MAHGPGQSGITWQVCFHDDHAAHEIRLKFPPLSNLKPRDVLLQFTWPKSIPFEDPIVEFAGRHKPDKNAIVGSIIRTKDGIVDLTVTKVRAIVEPMMGKYDAPLEVVICFAQPGCVVRCFGEVYIAVFAIQLCRAFSDIELELQLPRRGSVGRWIADALAFLFRKTATYHVSPYDWYLGPLALRPRVDAHDGKVRFDRVKADKDFPMVEIVYRKPMAVALHRVTAGVIGLGSALIAGLLLMLLS